MAYYAQSPQESNPPYLPTEAELSDEGLASNTAPQFRDPSLAERGGHSRDPGIARASRYQEHGDLYADLSGGVEGGADQGEKRSEPLDGRGVLS